MASLALVLIAVAGPVAGSGGPISHKEAAGATILVAKPPDTPKPKIASGRPTLVLALAQSAAVAADAVTTKRYERFGYIEADPLVKPLIGTRPTYARMAAFGSLEVAGSAWLARRYPRAGRWVQLAAIAAHVAAASHNMALGRRR